MGWGTTFQTEIYLNRQTFSNKYEVEAKIDELKDDLDIVKQKLIAFGAGNLSDIVPEDWDDDKNGFIVYQMRDLFEEYEETVLGLYKLELLLENYDNSKADI